MSVLLKAVMPCIKEGCPRNFEYAIDTDQISARIVDGGGIEIEWPTPDVLPTGWKKFDDYTSCFYCPEHS